jgi:hypothetical protein
MRCKNDHECKVGIDFEGHDRISSRSVISMDIYGKESQEILNRIADKIARISALDLLNTSVVCTLRILLKSVDFEE